MIVSDEKNKKTTRNWCGNVYQIDTRSDRNEMLTITEVKAISSSGKEKNETTKKKKKKKTQQQKNQHLHTVNTFYSSIVLRCKTAFNTYLKKILFFIRASFSIGQCE